MGTSFFTTEYTEAGETILKTAEKGSGGFGIDRVERVERVEFFSRVEHKDFVIV